MHKFVEAFIEAGVPPGAINAVYGDAIAPQLVSDPRVDFVSFTGLIRVGKIIRNAIGMKRVALELGGVGPTFVHGDADLAAAAEGVRAQCRGARRPELRFRPECLRAEAGIRRLCRGRVAARWTLSASAIQWTWRPRSAR
ncbi:MAG: aldehyde dehydrogenase family protein [Betaproteobacteria bacterium]|nr:aldehyde dehydrogenase family protein [Betaproteobacteria bacterium]